MFDLPDLPLALIMEEILEWEKPAKEKQDGTSLNNFEDVSDKRKEVVNKIEHLSTTSFMERNKQTDLLLKIPSDSFVDGLPGIVIQRLSHAGLDRLVAVDNDALCDCVNHGSALVQKLNETLLFAKLFFGFVVLLKLPKQLHDFIKHVGFLLYGFFESVFSNGSGGSSRVPKFPYNFLLNGKFGTREKRQLYPEILR